MKLLPVMTICCTPLPATTDDGEIVETTGCPGAGADETMKETGEEEMSPGFSTLTYAVSAAAIRPAGTIAVNCVELMNTVANDRVPLESVH